MVWVICVIILHAQNCRREILLPSSTTVPWQRCHSTQCAFYVSYDFTNKIHMQFSNQPYLSRCSKAIEHLFGYCGILYLYIYDTDKDSRASINGLHTNLVSGASVLTLKVIYACVYVSWVHVVNPKGLSCVSNITSMLVCTFISLKQSVISRVNTPNTVM